LLLTGTRGQGPDGRGDTPSELAATQGRTCPVARQRAPGGLYAVQTGRATADQLVQDVVEGYFDELALTREMLNSRYDDLEGGRVKPIDGDEFFEKLRWREDELLNQHPQR